MFATLALAAALTLAPQQAETHDPAVEAAVPPAAQEHVEDSHGDEHAAEAGDDAEEDDLRLIGQQRRDERERLARRERVDRLALCVRTDVAARCRRPAMGAGCCADGSRPGADARS